ncbi:MAG: hypothetical protein GY757_13250 [bacterium]|nr:hypothetical protein [bacterium]
MGKNANPFFSQRGSTVPDRFRVGLSVNIAALTAYKRHNPRLFYFCRGYTPEVLEKSFDPKSD